MKKVPSVKEGAAQRPREKDWKSFHLLVHALYFYQFVTCIFLNKVSVRAYFSEGGQGTAPRRERLEKFPPRLLCLILSHPNVHDEHLCACMVRTSVKEGRARHLGEKDWESFHLGFLLPQPVAHFPLLINASRGTNPQSLGCLSNSSYTCF